MDTPPDVRIFRHKTNDLCRQMQIGKLVGSINANWFHGFPPGTLKGNAFYGELGDHYLSARFTEPDDSSKVAWVLDVRPGLWPRIRRLFGKRWLRFEKYRRVDWPSWLEPVPEGSER